MKKCMRDSRWSPSTTLTRLHVPVMSGRKNQAPCAGAQTMNDAGKQHFVMLRRKPPWHGVLEPNGSAKPSTRRTKNLVNSLD